MGISEARKRANKKYAQLNTKMIAVQLNYNTDGEIIEWLEKQTEITGSRQGYIKALIEADMERNSPKQG